MKLKDLLNEDRFGHPITAQSNQMYEALDIEKLRCPHCGEHDTVEYVMIDQREKYNRRWE